MAAGDVTVGAGAWTAAHHAFTAPQDLETFDSDPGSALAYAYDIICNGNDRRRLHPYPSRDVQERVFAVMGLPKEEAQEKFGFLLDAFNYGLPPHGGSPLGGTDLRPLVGNRLDPRRDRLSEDRRRHGPADRRSGADHTRTAQGGWYRRPTGDLMPRVSLHILDRQTPRLMRKLGQDLSQLGR